MTLLCEQDLVLPSVSWSDAQLQGIVRISRHQIAYLQKLEIVHADS